MSSSTRIWPSQAALAPMPMVGMATCAVMLPRKRLGDGLEHNRERAGVGDRAGVLLDRPPVGFVAPLRAE